MGGRCELPLELIIVELRLIIVEEALVELPLELIIVELRLIIDDGPLLLLTLSSTRRRMTASSSLSPWMTLSPPWIAAISSISPSSVTPPPNSLLERRQAASPSFRASIRLNMSVQTSPSTCLIQWDLVSGLSLRQAIPAYLGEL